MSGPRLDPDRLLEHREFVRGLALRLVADHHAADDVVSETWLAALRNAPARPRSLRAWLARVTRNLALRAARGEVRRRRRELIAARPEREPAVADVVARLALEREVVDALLALDEPYRTTLLLRYYEDLAPREIAARTGANSATVRTRLKRGLDMLRARLDGALGDRRTWMLALVALVVPSKTAAASVAATTGGIVAMSAKSKTTLAAALLLAAVGGVLVLAIRSGRERAAPRAEAGKDHVSLAETAGSGSTGVVEQRVARGASVSIPVRVEDFSGRAIPGASVDCVATTHTQRNLGWMAWHHLFQVAAPEEVLARGVTGMDGIARFSRPVDSSCLFVARKQGLARGSSSKLALYGADDGRAITVRLGRAYPLSGRVLDDDGRPVSGALVIAASARTGWQVEWLEVPGRTRSDADGRYRFDDLPAREVALWAARSGRVPYRICTLDFPRMATFDFVLPQGGRVGGQVTNAETGAPVAGALVRVQGYYQHRGVARTDADGRYEVALPPTELSLVVVECPGYYQVYSQEAPKDGMLAGLGVRLDRGEEYNLDLVMRPAPKLFGRVTGPDGVLVGATIQAVSERGPMGLEYVRGVTDSEGRYELFLAPGRHRIEIGSRRLQFAGHRWINRNADASGKEPWIVDMLQSGAVERDIELVLDPLGVGTGRIEGRVEGPEGKPLAGARVWHFGGSVLTDAEGGFVLERLVAGPKRLRAHKAGFATAESATIALGQEGAVVSDVVLRLERERVVQGALRGVDLDRPFVLVASWPSGREQWGQALKSSAWSRLWLEAQRIPVAADGSFVVRPIVAGRTYLRAGALNAALSPVEEIRAQTGPVEIELSAGRTLRGQVIDQRTRRPVVGARVRLKSLRETNPYPYYSGFSDGDQTVVAVSDREGRFAVPHLLGEYQVKVSHLGYLDRQEPARDEATIELAPDLGIAGVVRYSDGAFAAGLKVRVHDLDGKPAGLIAKTGSDGRFSARRLGPGRYRLTIGGLTARTITTGAIEAGTKKLRITVERARDGEGEQWPEPVQGGGEIRGRIVDSSGRPLGGYRVWARHEKKQKESRLGRQVTSGANGHFVLAGLADGTYHLRASAPGGLLFAERRGVNLGTSDLKLVFDSIAGVVRDRAGGFPGGRRLRATRLGGEGGLRETTVGVDGRFRIEGLTPGEYRLSIEDPRRNYRLLPKTLYVAGARDLRLTASLGARITIRVAGEQGEAVQASAVAKREGQPTLYAKSDEQGNIELTGLREGEIVELVVRTRGFLPHDFGRVKAGARGLAAILRRGLRVTGRILDPEALPLVNNSVRLLHENGKFSAHGLTGGGGNFDIGGLIDGRYSVQVYRMEEGKGTWKTCGTVEARAREITLTLER